MIDPGEILAACKDAHAFAQNASSTMAEPFMNAVPDLSVASSTNASMMIGEIQQVGAKMLAHMENVKTAVDKQVAAHQDAQQRQKSWDFDVDMKDLRPTESVGFPQEMPANFFAPFKTGK